MILIVTIRDDVHALAVQRRLFNRGYSGCVVFECDHIADQNRVHWSIGPNGQSAYLDVHDHGRVDVETVDVIWWRRVRADQDLGKMCEDNHRSDLINNDCRGALSGMLASSFRGIWVSEPEATLRASDKIYQLLVAKRCGFRVPETLITQSRDDVVDFVGRLERQVIVKPVVGAVGPLVFTQFLRDPMRLDPESFQVCPAVYQEFIPGTQHIRLNCFGDVSLAAVIETDELDWRPNLNVPIRKWAVPDSLHRRVRSVLDSLGLAMGIVDLKLTPEGDVVWLEVNPQGQFLFLEPIAGIALCEIFADYLLSLTGRGRENATVTSNRCLC